MKQNRISDNVPMIVGEGRRLIRQSARRAGQISSQFARQGRKLVGSTVHQTAQMTRRHPWAGLGSAVGMGFLLGGLCTFLIYRSR